MKKAALYFVVLSGLTLGFSSCNDDAEEGNNLPSDDSALLRASTTIDYINDGDFQTGMETAADNDGLRTIDLAASFATCAALDIQTAPNNGFPKIFTLDFGNGCTNNDVTRSGILIFTLTGPILENGSHLTISRTNYYVNNYKVEGDVVYVNQTSNAAIPQWTRTIANGKVTTPSNIVYTHSGTRAVRQTEGVNTLTMLDNVYEITSGSHTVSRENGLTLTGTIVTPLIKRFNCNNISQGVLNLQGTYLDGNLDYGDNTCDNQAVYTHSDGQSYAVLLI